MATIKFTEISNQTRIFKCNFIIRNEHFFFNTMKNHSIPGLKCGIDMTDMLAYFILTNEF